MSGSNTLEEFIDLEMREKKFEELVAGIVSHLSYIFKIYVSKIYDFAFGHLIEF